VPQELAIYPLLTATENLEVFGSLYGVPRGAIAERVRWALAWSDLGERAQEPTKRFSGGMKRRLNIACSLMHLPSLLLLDEPTVGVDPQSRERIYEMLAERQRAGVSIVLTTHHLEEAERRCERIVIIDRGRTVADGTVAELVKTAVGAVRRLRVRLAQPIASAAPLPPGLTLEADGRGVTAEVRDVGRELAVRIEQVIAAGGDVADVALSGATLQDVFISLTGRELRE
jgi:ABC-2 type transport system ATP-binding protein